MAFKIMDDEFGQLTFTRVYQGTAKKGEMYFNQRTGKKDRFSRIVKMHADRREEIDQAEAGDIVAIMGLDCASGDTYAAEPNYGTLESMFVAEPVIKMSINPLTRDGVDRLAQGPAAVPQGRPDVQRLSPTKRRAKPSSPAWASCTSKSTSSASAASTSVEVEVGASEGELPRSPDRCLRSSITRARSKRAVRASTAAYHGQDGPDDRRRARRGRGRAAVPRQGRPAAAFRRTSFPPSKRA